MSKNSIVWHRKGLNNPTSTSSKLRHMLFVFSVWLLRMVAHMVKGSKVLLRMVGDMQQGPTVLLPMVVRMQKGPKVLLRMVAHMHALNGF